MSSSGSGHEARVLVEPGPITRVSLNRPARANALDEGMGAELEEALAQVSQQPDLRVVVLTGAGRHFCSGGDFAFIEDNTRFPREHVKERMLRFYRMYLSILDVPVPTLALLQGSVIGAGLCLALACDLRLGARSARLGANFLRVGLHPGMGASVLFPHVVGGARAAQLLLSAEMLSSEQALALGMLGELVEDQSLATAGRRRAEQLAQGAPLAARELVQTLRAPLRAALPAALQREAECQANNFASEDLRTAIAAFRRGQAPTFAGR